MDYKEAFFAILEEIDKRSAEDRGFKENAEGFVEFAFGILEKIDDKRSAMEFANKTVSETEAIIPTYEAAVEAVEILRKQALKSVGATEAPETPTEEPTSHGETSVG